ncbi:hypothetical protein AMJ87_09745 [candidate division WOR_3 bacterium SM23_60]|uniref:Fimbrial assembly protein n=1 Tax=candidate division WOR_3 bacterium SM23_60 TaxID=1703780 RepID=A0A0S8GA88_UNCW3|nr:MAG: hypothetical protein AMJ87_09745 [candidate division WOR_3 bacterium SM23_60]
MIKINLAPTAKRGRVSKRKPAAPGRPAVKLPSVQNTVLYIVGIVVAVLIIVIALLLQHNQIAGLNRNIRDLNIKLTELQVYKATVDSLKKREMELDSLITPIKMLNQNRFFIAHILDEVSSRIPEFTWLTILNVSQNEMQVKGVTASNLLVAEYMNRLEESPYIYNVDLSVLEKKEIENTEMMEFTLTANCSSDTSTARSQ